MISIGIDTGGTYTDAVACDIQTGEILAKGKVPTTASDLLICIGEAFKCLPDEYVQKAELIVLSTTLATNACVENKGGLAKLVILGTTKDVMMRIDAAKNYGIKSETVLCVDSQSSFDGRIVDEPDWEKLMAENKEWFSDAEALSIAEIYARQNGAVCEKNAKPLFESRYGVPVIAANEIANDLNVMERGATALLNARLLPIICKLIDSVNETIDNRGISTKSFAVRSDGSMMSNDLLLTRPVETILSGPAASVLGGSRLADEKDCLIIDMGGTTTDISIIKSGIPKMAGKGIHIGGWTTQVKGLYVDTFALGGDSAFCLENGVPVLKNRRVEPVSFAAQKHPEIIPDLKRLLSSEKHYHRDFHEFLYLAKMPEDLSKYSESEIHLMRTLESGCRLIDTFKESEGINKYRLDSERLEAQSIVVRCGLTPTDIMHVKGDFTQYKSEAAELMVKHFVFETSGERFIKFVKDSDIAAFADKAYDAVQKKLYDNIVRILLADRFPRVFDEGLNSQMQALVDDSWVNGKLPDFLVGSFSTSAALVGVGAPIHIFLPKVAEVLGTRCVIPEHAEVANAVGAALADITVTKTIEVHRILESDGIYYYHVYGSNGSFRFRKYEEARNKALERVEIEAIDEARMRGALGQLSTRTYLTPDENDDNPIFLGLAATAVVTGRIYSA